MTSTTERTTQQQPTKPQASRTPDGPFDDIVAELEERNVIAITAGVRRVLRQLYDVTTGNYLQCRLDESGGAVDMWREAKFRRFAFAHAHMVVFRARSDAGGQPTPAQLWDTARAVFPMVKDKYCSTLDRCPAGDAAIDSESIFRGQTCPTDIGAYPGP